MTIQRLISIESRMSDRRAIHLRVVGLASILVSTLFFSGCTASPDLKYLREFQEAEEAYTTAESPEEFAQVAIRYQRLIESGLQSGALFYNQGNAWMRAGQTGRAIASYRQAQRLRPRDPYLIANLQTALSAANSRSPIHPATGLAEYLFFWQNSFSYPEKFAITTTLLAAMLLLTSLRQFTSLRLFYGRVAIATAVMLALAVVSTGLDWLRFDQTKHGVIADIEVIARKGNSESYEPAFTSALTRGTEFTVLDQRSDWLHVKIEDTESAWIPLKAAVVY